MRPTEQRRSEDRVHIKNTRAASAHPVANQEMFYSSPFLTCSAQGQGGIMVECERCLDEGC